MSPDFPDVAMRRISDDQSGPPVRFRCSNPAYLPMKPQAIDYQAAMERMELYCIAHPHSPSATRRPKLMKRGTLWVALLGRSVNDGIAGFGPAVENALRAFDVQYLNALRAPIPA